MRFILMIMLVGLCIATIGCCQSDEDMDSMDSNCAANCLLKHEVGPCSAAFLRFYFDTNVKECKEFIWGGCEGVVPFETMEECLSCGCE